MAFLLVLGLELGWDWPFVRASSFVRALFLTCPWLSPYKDQGRTRTKDGPRTKGRTKYQRTDQGPGTKD